MKLTEKEFIKADGTVIKLTPEWISTNLGEVYELSHLDKIDQERLHYGYMTDELVSFLETTDEKGVPFFERVELKSIDVGNNRICNLLNQRIILDKPSKIERENFYHDFKLWPTTYSDEKKIDDIVVKVHSEFTLCNREGDLELHFNDNLVELNVFELINSYDKKEIYNFTFNIKNSLINRSSFSLAKGPCGNFSTTSVINSEINDSVIFSGLELLKDSIANYNTQLSGYSKVDSCFFDGGVTKEAKDGEKELVGYNTAANTFVDEPKKDVGQATNELEIL